MDSFYRERLQALFDDLDSWFRSNPGERADREINELADAGPIYTPDILHMFLDLLRDNRATLSDEVIAYMSEQINRAFREDLERRYAALAGDPQILCEGCPYLVQCEECAAYEEEDEDE